MRAGPLILSVVGIATLTIAAAGLRAQSRPAAPGYRLAAIDRGSVASTVRASGTLSPEQQVAVSPSGVGLLKELLVDDNSVVHAGDVLGRIDPTVAESHLALAQSELQVAQHSIDIAREQRDRARIGVDNAKAGRAAAVAELSHANDVLAGTQRDLQREQSLARTGDAARIELERAQTTAQQADAEAKAAAARVSAAATGVAAAQADVQVAEAQLQNVTAAVATHEAAVHDAELEVEHTSIRAPISGVVLDHTAVVGQFVSGAPGLFIIASDLHRMRLHASVDEADIGRISAGQPVTFTVDSFPGETFQGTVKLVKRSTPDGAERGHLRRHRRCRQSGPKAPAGHDRDDTDRDRTGDRCAARAERCGCGSRPMAMRRLTAAPSGPSTRTGIRYPITSIPAAATGHARRFPPAIWRRAIPWSSPWRHRPSRPDRTRCWDCRSWPTSWSRPSDSRASTALPARRSAHWPASTCESSAVNSWPSWGRRVRASRPC